MGIRFSVILDKRGLFKACEPKRSKRLKPLPRFAKDGSLSAKHSQFPVGKKSCTFKRKRFVHFIMVIWSGKFTLKPCASSFCFYDFKLHYKFIILTMPYHTLQFFFDTNSVHVEQKTPLYFMTETKFKIFRIQSKWYKRTPYVTFLISLQDGKQH